MVLILVLVATLIIAYLYTQRRPKNFPPGPTGFPIIGSLPLLGREPHKKGVEWKSKYGPLIGFNLGSFKTVMICDYKLVKEALNEPTFSSRPNTPFMIDRAGTGRAEGMKIECKCLYNNIVHEKYDTNVTTTAPLPTDAPAVATIKDDDVQTNPPNDNDVIPETTPPAGVITHCHLTFVGIIFSEGKPWQEQRRFALRRLRDFGFGTKSMETIVHEEIAELVERFKATAGTPISTSNKFNVAVVNALWTIVAGQRFNHDDPELNKVIKLITENLGTNSIRRMFSSFLPLWAKHGPNILTQYKEMMELYKPATEFLLPYIESHLKTHDPDHPRDFIDTYITEMKNTTDPTSSFRMDHKIGFAFTVFDLFLAGAETTSTTLTWLCLYMARHQYIQEKLAEEIDRVVGHCRLPALTDRVAMPYTEAVIHEVMRKATLIPFSIFHSTTEDVEFQGYLIPKDTMVLPNLYEAHNNIEIWGDPENFRPERFLSKDGTKFERREGFVPFSTGKRVCLGETLARDELFLFTTAFFQSFNVNVDPNGPPPTFDALVGGVLMPKAHKLVLTVRNK